MMFGQCLVLDWQGYFENNWVRVCIWGDLLQNSFENNWVKSVYGWTLQNCRFYKIRNRNCVKKREKTNHKLKIIRGLKL